MHCVPGQCFDTNPGKPHGGRHLRLGSYACFSFGPEETQVVEGVRRIGELVGRRAGNARPAGPAGERD